MKITELRCSACNGTLKIDPNDPHQAECEYCKTRYTLEWDDNSKDSEMEVHIAYTPPTYTYTSESTYPDTMTTLRRSLFP